nr:unnamed protein product [Spirometra erinaceieuropaei]
MVRQLHDGMVARVIDSESVSEAFAVTNGVKEGCVIVPTLFSRMFSVILMDEYLDECPGVRIANRTDGHLLNHRRMHFQSHVSTTTVHELLFAEDCALNTTSEEDIEKFGRIINTERTVVMYQPTPRSVPHSVNGAQPQLVENFAYLVSTLSRSTRIDDEVARRISKASLTFGRLRNTIWNPHSFHLNTKQQARRLIHFHLTCLPRRLKLRWQDWIPDTVVLQWTGRLGIYVLLSQLQLRWSVHHVRMDNERPPKRHFYGDVVTCSRRQGGQIHRYKDTLRTSLKRLQINPANWKDLA